MNTKFIHLTEIDSTNEYAKKELRNLGDKTLVYADIQTNGKGRNGRVWISSQRENLYFSLVLKNFLKAENAPNITQYMAIVICRLLGKYHIDAKIKWPNDVLVDSKKIAGILCETVIKGGETLGLVLGVGINLNFEQKILDGIDQPATALNILLGKKVNKEKFLNELLELFWVDYEKVLDKGFGFIRDEYIERCMFLGKNIRIIAFDEIYDGFAKDIDSEGRLVLENKDKKEIKINIGDMMCQ